MVIFVAINLSNATILNFEAPTLLSDGTYSLVSISKQELEKGYMCVAALCTFTHLLIV